MSRAQAIILGGPRTSPFLTTWNPADKSGSFTLSNANLTATKNDSVGNALCRATVSRAAGKFYFEVLLAAQPTTNSNAVGICSSSPGVDTFFGADASGYGYVDQGALYHAGSSTGATTYGVGDYVGVALDLDNAKIWFSKNGTYLSGDPAAGTSPTYSSVSGTFFPVVNSAYINCQWVANFGATTFHTAAPAGFLGWNG